MWRDCASPRNAAYAVWHGVLTSGLEFGAVQERELRYGSNNKCEEVTFFSCTLRNGLVLKLSGPPRPMSREEGMLN